MKKGLKNRVMYYRLFIVYIMICLVALGITVFWTEHSTILYLHNKAVEHLIVYDHYLTDKLKNYISAAHVLSENPVIIEFCNHPAEVAAMNEYLLRFNASVGAAVTYIMNTEGLTLSSSNYKSPQSFVGKNYNFREYFKKAVKGQPDRYIAIGSTSNVPGYYSAYPVKNGEDIVGVVVIKYDLNIFEPKTTAINGILLLVDANSVIFASNDERYRFHSINKLSDKIMQEIKDTRQYGTEPIPPLPITESLIKGNLNIVTIRRNDPETNQYVNIRYILESAHSTEDDWHMHLLVELSEVNKRILKNCLYVFLIASVIFLTGALMLFMSLDIKRRKEYEHEIQRINEELESRVEERTVQLNDYNLQLQTEITKRKKAEDILKKSVLEKKMLLRELHHRVKNNLQLISGLIELQIKYVKDETYKAMFIQTQNRIKSIALVHENLYSTEDLAGIDLGKYITTLTNELVVSLIIDESKIGLKYDIDNFSVGVAVAIPCGIIINELFTNILKHAFRDGKGGEIKLSLHKHEDDEIELIISDNGTGFPEDMDIRRERGLGLQIVFQLVRQLKGTIETDGTNGAKFIIRFIKSYD
ncbi:MAG: ATP-binding protein [Nitrospirae bacterium YQR-1]